MNQGIALFDFDGTITSQDSLIAFLRFVVGDVKFVIGLLILSPWLLLYLVKLYSNDLAKERMISYYLKGKRIDELEALAESFLQTHIEPMIRPGAKDRLAWHEAQGDTIVIVTASASLWIKPWAQKSGYALIATELEVINERVSGAFATNNCYGQEKVRRVQELYELEGYERVYAYGDSSGDKPMLALADEPYYKPFREQV
jgi:phosphatidylglycerophosphatase C